MKNLKPGYRVSLPLYYQKTARFPRLKLILKTRKRFSEKPKVAFTNNTQYSY